MTKIIRHTKGQFSGRIGQDRAVNLYRSGFPFVAGGRGFPKVDETTELDIRTRFQDSEMSELFYTAALPRLKEMLLPKYHFNEALYDLNLITFSLGPILSGSRPITTIAPDPNAPTDINRFRMQFSMDAYPYTETSSSGTSAAPGFDPELHRKEVYEDDFTGSWGTRHRFEIHKPDRLQCKFFQLWNPGEVRKSLAFIKLLDAVENGTGLYYPPFGFSDIKNQIQYQYDVEWMREPQYYASLIFDYLDSFGFDVSEVPFLPPKNVRADVQDSSLELTWDASSIVHGYNVYVNGVKHNSELIPGMINNHLYPSLDYSIHDLDIDNGEYEIWITSINGDWESDPSGVIHLPVLAPENVVAVSDEGVVTVDWSESVQTEGYFIYVDGQKQNAVPIAELSFSTEPLPNGDYSIAVTAVLKGIESEPSSTVIVTVKRLIPENFSVELLDHFAPENFNVEIVEGISNPPKNFNVELIDNASLIPENFNAEIIDSASLVPQSFSISTMNKSDLAPINFDAAQYDGDELIPKNFYVEQE